MLFFTNDDDRMNLLSQLSVVDLQKLVTACNASKDPEKAGQSVAKALVRLAEERDNNKRKSTIKVAPGIVQHHQEEELTGARQAATEDILKLRARSSRKS
jgi:hypothetical protein